MDFLAKIHSPLIDSSVSDIADQSVANAENDENPQLENDKGNRKFWDYTKQRLWVTS